MNNFSAQLFNPDSGADSKNTPWIPARAGDTLTWHGLSGSADALAVSELAAGYDGLVLVITKDSAQAQRWQSATAFFAASFLDEQGNNLQFPDWETLPYDAFSPHQDIISERLATLNKLPNTKHGLLTVPVTTLLQRIAPRSFLAGATYDFRQGQKLDIEQQRLTLDAAGYVHTDTVTERGQYAVRGSVMDIFPMGAAQPVRVDMFDEDIDTLRTFDPITQRTIERITTLQLLPAKEFPFDQAAVAKFRESWHHTFNVDVRRCSIYQDVSSYIVPNGIEYYLPFFFEELGTLFDFLPSNVTLVLEQGVIAAAEQHLSEIANRYESLRHDVERPIVDPATIFLALDELHRNLNAYPRVQLQTSPGKHNYAFTSQPLPDLICDARAKEPTHLLQQFVQNQDQPILFIAESAGRREIFDNLLRKAGISAKSISAYSQHQSAGEHCICVAQLSEGLHLPDCIIVTESDVLGTRQADTTRSTNNRVIDPQHIVRNLTELHNGAPVVHIEHGVGRYLGLQTLNIDGEDHEFLTLEYAANDKLYVPVTSLHLINRYAGSDEEHAPLHRLGSDQWEKARRRAAEKVVDVAAELLDIYARREMRQSFQFNVVEEDYDKFSREFPFEVTPDQQRAIDDTLADLTTIRAMDRLICGDVGFGKTEVAMRAVFVAVQAGKQVAVLVPTTLL
ncbi:MAG: transcription-repair coupling factor, partial [Gammaproteobacteria bacterium]|nr:transcription-repair coupling factor [Gammaproteobacteria bacterium]